MPEPALRLQILTDRLARWRLDRLGIDATHHFVKGKDPGLHGEPSQFDRVFRFGLPAGRAGGDDVQELEAPYPFGLTDLAVEVLGIGDGSRGLIGYAVGATIASMSFLPSRLKCLTGVVVVQAPYGVAPLRWMPVFI